MGQRATIAAVNLEPVLSPGDIHRPGSPLLGDFFKKMLDELYDGVYFVNTERRILYWNAAAERISGYSAAEVVGKSCSDNVLEHADADGCILCQHACPLVVSIRTRQAVCKRVYLKHRMGHRLAVEVRTSPVTDDRGRIMGAVEVFRDAGAELALESAYRQARDLAAKDPLTGLANRRFLTSFVAEQLEVGCRADRHFALILLDVDHFKAINDENGHKVGDVVLQRLSDYLRQGVRDMDLVARFGGEEFLILLPGADSRLAGEIAERIRSDVANLGIRISPSEVQKAPEGVIRITVSLGVGSVRPGEDPDGVIRRVDEAMYRAKSGGRNRTVLETMPGG